VLCALIWAFTAAKLDSERNATQVAAIKQVQSLANSYAAQLTRTVEQIDQLVLSLKIDWEEPTRTVDLERQRAKGLFPNNALLYATVIDHNGEVRSTTIGMDTQPSFADIDYFLIHKKSPTTELLITGPMLGRRLGRPVIRFTRRLNAQDGTFDGVAVVVAEPAFLTTFHDANSLDRGDFISVRYVDGRLVASQQRDEQHVVFYRSNPVFAGNEGTVHEAGEKFRDNTGRFVSWKKIPKYPLVAIAAVSEENAFASYKRNATSYKNLAWGTTLIIIGFTLLGMYLSAHLAARRHREEEVRKNFRLATDAANEGFFIISPVYSRNGGIENFRFEDCNERGAALNAKKRDDIVGKLLHEIMPEGYGGEVFKLYCHAMETGFFEDEFRVPSASPLQAAWVYRRVVRSNDGLVLTLRDISKAKEHEHALSRQANTDALTSLPNRHWLAEFLPNAITRAADRRSHFAILFIDLDNFKNINDSVGHDAGDELLKSAALRIKTVVRMSDHVVRLGGDEFTVILEKVDVLEDVSGVAKKIIQVLNEPFHSDKATGLRVSGSIGISVYPQDGANGETLLKHADVAMYAAKAAGKGRLHFYQSHLSDALLLKLSKERALLDAIEKDQFVMHFQPRVGAESGRLSSMEALVRWEHPERGLVYPDEFIDLAESTGMIIKLGEIVIEKVCAQIADWTRQGLAVVPVSLNVSALQLKDGYVSAFLKNCLCRHHINASLIEVELTESCVIDESKRVTRELAELRTLGVKLLIDDFGTGYSSLAQLHQLDVDVLKVDRAFTSQLGKGTEGEVVFHAIVSMADALNMCVVAEGVETETQLEILRKLSCDEIQGYLVAPALPAFEIPALILRNFLLAPLALER
jgi:diguanylate cyclase (GGDEF)-like protein